VDALYKSTFTLLYFTVRMRWNIYSIIVAGNSTLDDLMMHLMHTVEMFHEQLDADIVEEVSNLQY